MTKPILISPSILSADFARLGEEVVSIDQAGADMIHIDVMDGHYVPNLTFGAGIISAIRGYTHKPLDVHLMIKPVDSLLDSFIAAKADTICFHPEASLHPHRTLMQIKAGGDIEAGIAMNPDTTLASVKYLLPYCDFVLIMSVNPGFGGQKFIPYQLNKIAELRQYLDTNGFNNCRIAVDGGVSSANASAIIKAGADTLIAGSAIFTNNRGDYANNIAALRTS